MEGDALVRSATMREDGAEFHHVIGQDGLAAVDEAADRELRKEIERENHVLCCHAIC